MKEVSTFFSITNTHTYNIQLHLLSPRLFLSNLQHKNVQLNNTCPQIVLSWWHKYYVRTRTELLNGSWVQDYCRLCEQIYIGEIWKHLIHFNEIRVCSKMVIVLNAVVVCKVITEFLNNTTNDNDLTLTLFQSYNDIGECNKTIWTKFSCKYKHNICLQWSHIQTQFSSL